MPEHCIFSATTKFKLSDPRVLLNRGFPANLKEDSTIFVGGDEFAKRCGILITEESVAFTFGGLAQSIQLEELKGCQNLVKQ
jgi:hypothetical protein